MSSIFVTSDLCLMVPSNFLKPSYVCFKWTLIQCEMEHAEFRTRRWQLFSVKILSVWQIQRSHRSSTGAAQRRWIGSRVVRVVGVYIKEKGKRIQVFWKIHLKTKKSKKKKFTNFSDCDFSDFSHFRAFQKVGKKFSFHLKLGFWAVQGPYCWSPKRF